MEQYYRIRYDDNELSFLWSNWNLHARQVRNFGINIECHVLAILRNDFEFFFLSSLGANEIMRSMVISVCLYSSTHFCVFQAKPLAHGYFTYFALILPETKFGIYFTAVRSNPKHIFHSVLFTYHLHFGASSAISFNPRLNGWPTFRRIFIYFYNFYWHFHFVQFILTRFSSSTVASHLVSLHVGILWFTLSTDM